jgi:CRISPR system Cascade subunit CasC
MTEYRYIDVHVLQTLPPSNLNRDDTGAPKTAIYGGARRLRVSSQAWKRAVRVYVKEHGLLEPDRLGLRTRNVVDLIKRDLVCRGKGLSADAASVLATAALGALGLKLKKNRAGEATDSSEYLLFFGQAQLHTLVDQLLGLVKDGVRLDDEKSLSDAVRGLDLQSTFGPPQAADVALFGRMVADDPKLNVEAACQVAHALSTHAVETEFDYFTAVDDVPTVEQGAGAGHLGTVEFASATMYRFATVDVAQLVENLAGDKALASRVVGVFVEAFVKALPKGKQNSFAAHTLPNLVLVCARSDQPVSYVGAFETPVKQQKGGGYVPSAIAQLVRAHTELSYFTAAPPQTWVSCPEELPADGLGPSVPLDNLVEELSNALRPVSAF